MKIRIINGPNINFLGIREPSIYGNMTYLNLTEQLIEYGKKNDIIITVYQTNHEGKIIDLLQETHYDNEIDAVILNAGGYTHTSIALLDALKAVNIPAIEVHISDVSKREDFRQISYISLAVIDRVIGKGF